VGAVADSAARRRPDGITILSVLLFLMAFTGLVNAVIWNASFVQELLRKVSEPMAAWLGGPTFTALMLAYAATATLSAIGLLTLRPWSVWAYVAWCASMAAIVGYGRMWDSASTATANAVAGVVGCAIFLVACPYIARHTRAQPV
jgi:hypothetical protein